MGVPVTATRILKKIYKFLFKVLNYFIVTCKKSFSILFKFFGYFMYICKLLHYVFASFLKKIVYVYIIVFKYFNNNYFLKAIVHAVFLLFLCFKTILKIFVLYHWHVFMKFYLMFLKLGWLYIVTAWLYVTLNYLPAIGELDLDTPEVIIYPFITHINIIESYEIMFDLASFSFLFL